VFLVTVLIDQPRLFVFGVLLAGLGFVATLDVLDTDAFVARQNVTRYQKTGKLDVFYLNTLSDDATPFLVPLLDSANEEDRNIIGTGLHIRLHRADIRRLQNGWPSWNWAQWRTYQLLDARRSELEQYPTPFDSSRD
jgi:hypothetical protein